MPYLTPYPELNDVLSELVASMHSILGANFTGAYLQGSLAGGDFDSYSDVDFLVVVKKEICQAELSALQAMHARIHDRGSYWATHLEGSYFPDEVLADHSRLTDELWFLNNTSRTLERSKHDNTLVVRWMLYEHGITLAGPDPQALLAPVPVDALKREVLTTMDDWGQQILKDPEQINRWWAQPFAVLGYCRMLHTLQSGQITSKRVAAKWAESALDKKWSGLIRRAWDERPLLAIRTGHTAGVAELAKTLEFIRYALETARAKPFGHEWINLTWTQRDT
jgi:predicted nucleotidyltransferase